HTHTSPFNSTHTYTYTLTLTPTHAHTVQPLTHPHQPPPYSKQGPVFFLLRQLAFNLATLYLVFNIWCITSVSLFIIKITKSNDTMLLIHFFHLSTNCSEKQTSNNVYFTIN